MPCYTRYQWAEKVQIANRDLFKAGLEAKGLTITESGSYIYFRGALKEGRHTWNVDGWLETETGELTCKNKDHADAIRRTYAEKVVSNAARRYGWTENKQSDGSTLLKRRS